jgi:hypothetical protein
MRIRLPTAVLPLWVVGVLLVPGAAAQVPTQDSVTATGNALLRGGGGFFLVDIQARSGPSGESPSGSASFRLGNEGGPLVSGEVTCLNVSGRVATLLFRDVLFGLVTVDLTDNAGTGSMDTMAALPLGSCTPDPDPPLLGEFNVGGVEVIDAQPLPTSRDQCKNGGWRNFPGFKNQGDCVSFVAKRKP